VDYYERAATMRIVLKKWRSFLLSTATYMPVFAPWLTKGIWIRVHPDHPEWDIKWPPDPETKIGRRPS
jgi:hypothetical protein